MITSQQASLFGLSSQEKKILNLLNKDNFSLTVTNISEKIDEPRTTVGFHLNKLLKKGWVRKFKKPRQSYPLWELAEDIEIRGLVADFLRRFGIEQQALNILTAKEGYGQLIAAYEKILCTMKGERIYVIQGSRAASFAMSKIPASFMKKIHNIQKEKQFILDGITGENVLQLFDRMTKAELESHYGRLTVAYLVPDRFLDFDGEIYVCHNDIIVIEPGKNRSLIISDEMLSTALIKIIGLLEISAKKVDLNKYINDLIKSKIQIN